MNLNNMDLSTEQKLELLDLAEKVSGWLMKNGNHHISVIISSNRINIVEDVCSWKTNVKCVEK